MSAASGDLVIDDAFETQLAVDQLRAMDLIALRRDVTTWRNAYAGPIAARVAEHATSVQQIIDRLTILQRGLESGTQGTNNAAQIRSELERYHEVWPAWLMADFDPPPALRTITVTTNEQLDEAIDGAQPGDEIILAAGEWTDVVFDALHRLTGEPARPIVVRAQTPGDVVISSELPCPLPGRNVIFRDLTFRGGGVCLIDDGRNAASCFAFGGENLRVSNCVFYAPEPCGGVVLNATGMRFDRNYLAGHFAGVALRVAARRSLLDGNYFGWRMQALENPQTAGSAVEIVAAATHTELRSNFFSGPGASLRDNGALSMITDNTFQNIPGTAIDITAVSREAVIRGNLAFDVGGISLNSNSARFLNNYLESARIDGVAERVSSQRESSQCVAEHNTLIFPQGFALSESSELQPGVLRGSHNMICTETRILWPEESPASVAPTLVDGEEETSNLQVMRDVLGYLRPHIRFGRLGFQGEALPLGRGSEVGPSWLPSELSINRPLAQEFAAGTSIAVDAGHELLSVESPTSETRSTSADAPSGWTLQGWVHNVRSRSSGCVLARAVNGRDHWELSLTDDHRLKLAGETGGAAWSMTTEPDYESEAGRSYFAMIVERKLDGYEVSFFRGNEVDSVDLIAMEIAPAGAFLNVANLEFVQQSQAGRGLISARVFSWPGHANEASWQQFGILNVSDLESLRQGDLLRQ